MNSWTPSPALSRYHFEAAPTHPRGGWAWKDKPWGAEYQVPFPRGPQAPSPLPRWQQAPPPLGRWQGVRPPPHTSPQPEQSRGLWAIRLQGEDQAGTWLLGSIGLESVGTAVPVYSVPLRSGAKGS